LNFCLWYEKNGEYEFVEGKGRPSKKDAWSVEKISIIIGDLIMTLWNWQK
jgi:hypothetical protein